MKQSYESPQLQHYGVVSSLTGYETPNGDQDDFLDQSGNPIGAGSGSLDGCVRKGDGTGRCYYAVAE